MTRHWTQARLSELVEPVRTTDPRRNAGSKITYVDLSAVDRESKTITAPVELAVEDAPSRARQVLASGDVLVSTVRPNLNAVAAVPASMSGAIGSTGFTVLRPGLHLDARYLFHFAQTPGFVDHLATRTTGASYPAVTDRTVKSMSIPLPPLDEQRRIARMLDASAALHTRSRDCLEVAALVETAGLRRILTGRAASHEVLGNLVASGDRINYGVVQPGVDVPDGIPLIRAGDLRGGRVVRDNLRTVHPDVDRAYARSRIVGNEVLLGCVGSIGEVALVGDEDVGSNVVRAVARIPIESRSIRLFVAAYLRSPVAQRYFQAELRTVAQPTLNIKQIRELDVPLPSPTQLSDFEALSDASQSAQARISAQVTRFGALFRTLQHRAFVGDL